MTKREIVEQLVREGKRIGHPEYEKAWLDFWNSTHPNGETKVRRSSGSSRVITNRFKNGDIC